MTRTFFTAAALFALVAPPAQSAMLDGLAIPSEGLPLLATQDSATGFGDAVGGGQDSAGGSELNQLFAEIDGNTLKLGITGNLEGNFNKMWIFFDAVSGGEDILAGDNADGGFGEINALAGLGFSGATMDHALRFEVGGGFLGVRYADLIDNAGGDIFTSGGVGSLPLVNTAGGLGVSLGWDNANTAGVDGGSAAGAATATSGWELEIDIPTFFGAAPRATNITALVSNGGGDFLSNQVLPGIGGPNLEGASGKVIGFVTVPVPEPATAAWAFGLLAAAAATRRRG